MGKMIKYILVLLLLTGCSTYSPYEWRASEMYKTYPSYKKCRHRIVELAQEMKADGVEFSVVIMKKWPSSKTGHCWILYEGREIDPTRMSRNGYTVTLFYWRINQNQAYDEYKFNQFCESVEGEGL